MDKIVKRHLYVIFDDGRPPTHSVIDIRLSDSWDITNDTPLEDHGDYALREVYAPIDQVVDEWCDWYDKGRHNG